MAWAVLLIAGLFEIVWAIALKHSAVLRGSSAGKRPSIFVVPLAIEPNKRARCDMDLSPGTFTFPQSSPPFLRFLKDLSLVGTFN